MRLDGALQLKAIDDGTLTGSESEESVVAAFDADRLGKQVCLRSPRPGDRIQPLGMSGHKKLSDLFTDCKWPRILRDEVLVLACGAEIAWVAPLCSSHAFRVDAATVRMAVCRLRPAHREA